MLLDEPSLPIYQLKLFERPSKRKASRFSNEGPMYRSILFNLEPKAYLIDQRCSVREQTRPNALWLMHAYLGLGHGATRKLAEAIETFRVNADSLRIGRKRVR